jgi:16S rRNA processing protein RimM
VTGAGREDADFIVVARITKTQGRIGEVAAEIMTDFPERFAELDEVIVRLPDGKQQSFTLSDSWLHKDRVILKFDGIDSITAAEGLIGGTVLISSDELIELPEDSFFDFELEGCEVVDRSNRRIGVVREVVRTGGTELLSVIDDAGSEKLIPFAESICVEVDADAKRIVIEPPEGLLEL